MVTRKRFDWNDEGTWPMRMDYLDVPPEKRPTFESFLAQIGLDEPPRPRNQTFQNGDSELDYELDNVTTYCAACGSIAKFGKLHVRVGFDGRILFIDNICDPCYWKRQNSGRLQPLSPEGEAELSLKDGGVPGHMVKCRFWNYRTQELSGSAEVLDCLKALSGNGITVDGTFTGTAASSVGAVDAVNAKGFTVVDTYVDDTEKTYLTGNPVFADKDKDSSVTVATGTVNAGQIGIVTDDTKDAYIGFFAIAEGATLDVSGQYNRANASVDASKMTVDGTMNVANNGKVTITDALTVRGTFTVASADDNGNSAGIADIKKMYVGIAENKDKKFVDASAATVTSDETIASLATIYVSGESTITGDLTSNMQSTEFYVEDALWMTVYATSGAASELNFVDVSGNGTENSSYKYAYNFQPGDLDNSEFVYWADANGEQIIDGNAKVGDSDYQQVYANLNYDIYTITVFADPGIQAVYVDGKLMTSGTFQTGVDGMWAQGFRLSVAAGEHEITYKLGNYYSGEAKMTVNGTAVEGNTFTTSGTTTADKNVTIYLQGVQASGPETPSTTGGDDGMGLTDYLLIILVVLIVIMAIIVALRLMRS